MLALLTEMYHTLIIVVCTFSVFYLKNAGKFIIYVKMPKNVFEIKRDEVSKEILYAEFKIARH